MSKILLAAVNASFSHTNIAVRSLSLYCENPEVSFGEWTINQMPFDVLREIREKNPQMVLFSVYIWNVDFIEKIIKNLKKLPFFRGVFIFALNNIVGAKKGRVFLSNERQGKGI